MESLTSFTQQTRPKILLVGPPFSGKTTLALRFPDPFVVDLDGKITNALKTVRPERGWVTQPLNTDKGQISDPTKAWQAIDNAVTEACLHPDSKTVVLDSISMVDFWLRRYVANAKPTNINPVTIGGLQFMAHAHWNPYEVLLRGLLGKLLAVKKIAVVTAHVEVIKDDIAGGIFQAVLMPGKSQAGLPAIFTDCWLVNGKVEKDTWHTVVRTAPGGFPRMNCLGTSLDLPFEFDDPTILDKALEKWK